MQKNLKIFRIIIIREFGRKNENKNRKIVKKENPLITKSYCIEDLC